MKVKIVELEKGFTPIAASKGACCLDVFAREISYDKTHGFLKVKLGFKVEVPNGYVMNLIPRSSVSEKGLSLCNSVGKIDTDFRGEVQARFYAQLTPGLIKSIITSNPEDGIASYMMSKFKKGESCAQIEFVKNSTRDMKLDLVDESKLSETERGEGGHGSTNKTIG